MDSSYLSKNSLGAAGSSGPIYQGDTASRPATALNVTHAALEEARSLAFRVSELVDRLCGCQPENTPDLIKGQSMSVLGGLRDDAERTVDAVRIAHTRLNRLDNEI